MFDPLTIPLRDLKPDDALHTPARLAPPAGASDAQPAERPASPGAVTRERIDAVLRGAARGLGFAAAELWVIDATTQALDLHAGWDLSTKPAATRRPLAGAEADLAAIAGGAVVIESADDATPWTLHRAAESAIGVPVASATTVHGVLWLVGIEPRRLGDEVVELAEIIAGRLALELEADPEFDAARVEAAVAEIEERSRGFSLDAELPTSAPTIGEVEIAGRAFHNGSLALHDRHELPDGRVLALAASIVDAPGEPSESALVAAQTARVAARTLAESANEAGDLLEGVNRALFDATHAGEGVAMAIALLDPPETAAEDGEPVRGSFASAGPAGALRIRAAGTTAVLPDSTPLGWDQDAAYATRPFELEVRERLVLIAGDVRLASPLVERRLTDAFRSVTADGHRSMDAAACVKRLAQAGCEEVDAVVALRRR